MVHQSPSSPPIVRRCGVGIDTSRYGHYAAFLREDLQTAADELQFVESAEGYGQLRQRLNCIAEHHGPVHFVVRLDAAGQYADNLLHFLHALNQPVCADQSPAFVITVSCGDPNRNKNYRAALFGPRKSDPIEARAAARFALTERPTSDRPLSLEFRALRQVAGRLQAVVRQRTRLINQLHHLTALTFPELALVVHDFAAGWVLELLNRYPTAPRLAQATADDLSAIPYLQEKHRTALLDHARTSIGSLSGATVEELVRDQVRQIRDAGARQKRLETLLVSAYQGLPTPNHLDTIPGIGAVTAAVLTAFVLDIDRFDTPGKLVAYFGALPIEVSSGVDRDGQARTPRRYIMSRRGNDLVRRYLWMAALSAIRCNPAVRALYARVVAKHPQHKAVAVGHAMRKLLHLVFAIWKTRRPFNPKHYPWEQPTQVDGNVTDTASSPKPKERDAGPKPVEPAQTEVTAPRPDTVANSSVPGEGMAIDFTHVKQQLPIARVLDHLGLSARLKGTGTQRRCPCPIHRGDARSRTFSANLNENVYQCFDASCGSKGDVIDLWAAVRGLSLRAAALDLVHTFGLEPSAPTGTGKRNG
jgi:transposase